MVMQMAGSNGVLSVPSEHLPGLVVLILVGPVVWLAAAGLRTWWGPITTARVRGGANEVTQPMMHCGLTPVSGGPLTPDPSALSEVDAAAQMPVLNPQNAIA
jgi:hypothetical protein